ACARRSAVTRRATGWPTCTAATAGSRRWRSPPSPWPITTHAPDARRVDEEVETKERSNDRVRRSRQPVPEEDEPRAEPAAKACFERLRKVRDRQQPEQKSKDGEQRTAIRFVHLPSSSPRGLAGCKSESSR